jgi:hypothetical protein
MTTQALDSVNYCDEEYAIAGMAGVGLFRPEDHGLVAHPYSSAHGRGYYCEYSVDRGNLFLKQFNIGLSAEDSVNGVHVFGHALEPYASGYRQLARGTTGPVINFARGMQQPVLLSGGLLLGAESSLEQTNHMGFHPAGRFRVIHELIFEQGQLRKASDRTSAWASFRESIASPSEYWRSEKRREMIEVQFKSIFSLDYMRGYT